MILLHTSLTELRIEIEQEESSANHLSSKAIEIRMEVWVSLEWDISKIENLWKNVDSWIQLILNKVWLMIQNRAKQNAPVRKLDNYKPTPSNKKRRWWTLRKSIWADFDYIQKWIVVVWSDVKYARVREYVNNLQPHTKKYLRRWYSENKDKIKDIINKGLSEKLK